MSDDPSIRDIVDAIERGSVPLHMAIGLSCSCAQGAESEYGPWHLHGCLQRLWAESLESMAMVELLHETGHDVPVAVAIRAARLAASKVGIDLSAGLWPEHILAAEHAIEVGATVASHRAEAAALAKFEGAWRSRPIEAAWEAIHDAFKAAQSTHSDLGRNAVRDSLFEADLVIRQTDMRLVPDLIRPFGPPTLEQILEASARP